eukprot:g3521.t1
MPVHSLFIINKAGSLIYYDAFPGSHKLDVNDIIRVGSTFDTFCALMKKMTPVASDEETVIEEMTTDTFTLRNFRTVTGFTFFVTASLGTKQLDEFLKSVYRIFADYVLKNPFYTMDQTINKEISSLFGHHINKLVKSHQMHGY